MFLSWEGFASRLTQIYGDLESVVIAKRSYTNLYKGD
jgi:hypothetical protein